MKYFTSDTHLAHDKLMKFCERPFETIEEMNEIIISNILSPLKPGDELYFIGDLAWRRYALDEFFDKLPKKINFHWILGNHDKNWQPFKKRCTSIAYMKRTKIDGNTVILNHWPMLTWDKSHYNSWMLFGHHHRNSNGTSQLEKMIQGKMLNINLEFNNYMPYSEKEITKIMEEKPDNWDLIKEGR